jgi:transposase
VSTLYRGLGRFHINIYGAVHVGSQEIITRTYETINQKSVCHFLKGIRGKNKNNQKTYLALDKASYHKAEAVKSLAKL